MWRNEMESQRYRNNADAVELLGDEIEERMVKMVPRPELAHFMDLHVNTTTREIFVNGEIGEEFGEWFLHVFRYLLTQSDEAITIWLNTPGGDMESMFVFHDLVRNSPAEVVVIGQGGVASAGCLMLACGHRRLVTESCVLMWHEWSGEFNSGRYSELKERRQFEDWTTNHWFELISKYVKPASSQEERDVSWWRRKTKMKAEWWILGGQAIIEEGFADELFFHDKLPAPAKRR